MGQNLVVAYACDDNYVMQTGISLISLFENNKEFKSIKILFVDMGVSDNSKEQLIKIVDKYGREISFVKFEKIAYDLNANRGPRHINSIYAKMFLHRIDEKIEKVLYIDSDTIIAGSLIELWTDSIDGKCIAATYSFTGNKEKRLLRLDNDHIMFNDGIVLIDLEKWRKKDYLNACLKLIDVYGGKPPLLSEGVLNYICKDDVYILPPCYNCHAILSLCNSKQLSLLAGGHFYSEHDVKEAIRNPVIIHYSGGMFIRPWMKGSNYPLHASYDKYKQLSPWKDVEYAQRPQINKSLLLGALLTSSPSLYIWSCKTREKLRQNKKGASKNDLE